MDGVREEGKGKRKKFGKKMGKAKQNKSVNAEQSPKY